MNHLLSKLLNKRGLKRDQLDNEEKQDYERWEKILSGGEITVSKIEEFCRAQINIIETKWKSMELDNSKKAEMIPYHTVYSTLLKAIKAPEVERVTLEEYLNQLLNI